MSYVMSRDKLWFVLCEEKQKYFSEVRVEPQALKEELRNLSLLVYRGQ